MEETQEKRTIRVNPLKRSHFEMEFKAEDTVADLKNRIETVLEPDVYPAALQMLFFNGRILKDESTLGDNNVSGKRFISLMLTKNKSSVRQGSTTLTETASTAKVYGVPLTSPVTWSEEDIQSILDLKDVSWTRGDVIQAFRATSTTLEEAIEYLYSRDIRCPVSGEIIFHPEFTEGGSRESRYLSDFEELEHIATGGFGSVHKVKSRLDGSIYAAKKIPLNEIVFELVCRKVRAMARLNHPGVIRYYYSWIEPTIAGFVDPDLAVDSSSTVGTDLTGSSVESLSMHPCLYIVMAHCPSCLSKDLEDNKIYDDQSTAWRTFRQITEALMHIHDKGIIHRDLCPRNIFIDDMGDVKIGDFGLAKLAMEDAGNSLDFTGSIGQALYKAPELKGGGQGDAKSDIFSIGMILVELLERFKTGSERFIELQKYRNDLSSKLNDVSFTDITFLRRLLDHDPSKRPSAKEIVEIWKPWLLQFPDPEIHC